MRNISWTYCYVTTLFLLLFLPSNAYAQISASILEIPKEHLALKTNEFNATFSHDFTPVTLPIKLQSEASYWVKLTLSKEDISPKLGNLLILYSELGRDNISYSSDYQANAYDPHVIHLSKDTREVYLFKLTNMVNTLYFNATLLNEFDYYHNNSKIQTLYGITYGVMLAAVIYYLAFFLFNRKKSYLYYALTQLCMLLILAMLTDKSSGENDAIMFGIAFTFFILFNTLFSYYFLGLKRLHPFYRYTLFGSAAILIIEVFTDLFSKLHIPTTQLMLLFPLYAFLIYRKSGAKYIIFYILGWGLLISSLLFIEIQILFLNPPLIEAITLMHLSMPLESLIFAFALSYKMRIEAKEQLQREHMLIHYDKRASIGDMVDTIAHQWRQPLTRISYLVMSISGAVKNSRFTEQFWQTKQHALEQQLDYMSQSINDFRDFYQPTATPTNFNATEALQKVLQILEPTLKLDNITCQIVPKQSLYVYGFESELMQVVLNIANNAIEAFETFDRQTIPNRHITIIIQRNAIHIEDNALGVDEALVPTLFDARTTTKNSGSGQGLYISKLIIEQHFNANLRYEAILQGSRFVIQWL